MNNGTVPVVSVNQPQYQPIHYTSVPCRWLPRGDLHCIEGIMDRGPGVDAACTVAVSKQIKTSLLSFWYEQQSSSQGFIVFLLLFYYVNSFLSKTESEFTETVQHMAIWE